MPERLVDQLAQAVLGQAHAQRQRGQVQRILERRLGVARSIVTTS